MIDWFRHLYPYTNEHELNLDWIIDSIQNLLQAFEDFKGANSITFANPIRWNINTQYSNNTIVISDSGDAYLSIAVVPKGIQLDNTNYWLEIFNFATYVRTANSNLTVNVELNTTRATSNYAVDDWLLWNDVLYKVTAAINFDDLLIVGTNIVHFTVEDFCRAWVSYANALITQYKNDIDASELAYKNQLDASIAATTASLQSQLNLAIAGATVDSEVINARLGADGITYSTLGEAIRAQVGTLNANSNVLFESINGKASFINPINGTVSTSDGSVDRSTNIRLTTSNIIKLSYSILVNVASGYSAWIAYYDDNGTYLSWESLMDDDLHRCINAGSNFRIILRRNDNGAITVDEYNAITFKTYQELVNELSINENYCEASNYYHNLFSLSDINDIVFGTAGSSGITKNKTRLINKSVKHTTTDLTVKAAPGYDYQSWVAYYADPDDAGYSSYSYIRDMVIIPAGSYYRIVIGKTDNSNVDITDALKSIYVQSALSSDNGVSNYLKVCTFNVGKWFNGVDDGVPNSNLNDYIIRWHKMIGEFDPDIILMQEAVQYFDRNDTVNPYSAVLEFKYPYKYNVGYNTEWGSSIKQQMIVSKVPLINPTINSFGDGRGYIKFAINVCGSIVNVICTHLSTESNSSGDRQNEISALITEVSGLSNVIIGGDFNTYALSELDAFRSAGLQVANDGLFGDFETWPHTSDSWPNGCIDNIVTKNFDIQFVERGNPDDAIGSTPLSDHTPLYSVIRVM